jgi:hypothetical protein
MISQYISINFANIIPTWNNHASGSSCWFPAVPAHMESPRPSAPSGGVGEPGRPGRNCDRLGILWGSRHRKLRLTTKGLSILRFYIILGHTTSSNGSILYGSIFSVWLPSQTSGQRCWAMQYRFECETTPHLANIKTGGSSGCSSSKSW